MADLPAIEIDKNGTPTPPSLSVNKDDRVRWHSADGTKWYITFSPCKAHVIETLQDGYTSFIDVFRGTTKSLRRPYVISDSDPKLLQVEAEPKILKTGGGI